MRKLTRILAKLLYGITGAAFLAAGVSTLLVNTGLLPDALRDIVLRFSQNNPAMLHIIQEFGTLLVLVSLLTFWFLRHYERSQAFHWAVTTYWAIMATIHWFNVAGPWQSVVGPLVNTVPFLVFFIIGLLRAATEGRAVRAEANSMTAQNALGQHARSADTLSA
jgi:hypothetical protein